MTAVTRATGASGNVPDEAPVSARLQAMLLSRPFGPRVPFSMVTCLESSGRGTVGSRVSERSRWFSERVLPSRGLGWTVAHGLARKPGCGYADLRAGPGFSCSGAQTSTGAVGLRAGTGSDPGEAGARRVCRLRRSSGPAARERSWCLSGIGTALNGGTRNNGVDHGSSSDVRRLKFYPDDTADPVWDAETGSHVDIDWLPLDRDVRAALRAWAQAWGVLLDRMICASSGLRHV
jgi:hypothetical protein